MALVQILLLAASLCFSSEALAQNADAPDKLLTVWAGTLPIILSAPHSGRQQIPGVSLRRGVGIAQFAASRDANTDELAQKIAANMEERFGARPFLIVALFERKYVDANRPAGAAYESDKAKPYYESYRRVLRYHCERAREEWGRGLLLDIHGQGAEDEAIYRGTSNAALRRRSD
jgi:N-formylglutamate amidohydrolase